MCFKLSLIDQVCFKVSLICQVCFRVSLIVQICFRVSLIGQVCFRVSLIYQVCFKVSLIGQVCFRVSLIGQVCFRVSIFTVIICLVCRQITEGVCIFQPAEVCFIESAMALLEVSVACFLDWHLCPIDELNTLSIVYCLV